MQSVETRYEEPSRLLCRLCDVRLGKGRRFLGVQVNCGKKVQNVAIVADGVAINLDNSSAPAAFMISELTIGRDPTFLEELEYQLCEGVLLEIDVTGTFRRNGDLWSQCSAAGRIPGIPCPYSWVISDQGSRRQSRNLSMPKAQRCSSPPRPPQGGRVHVIEGSLRTSNISSRASSSRRS